MRELGRSSLREESKGRPIRKVISSYVRLGSTGRPYSRSDRRRQPPGEGTGAARGLSPGPGLRRQATAERSGGRRLRRAGFRRAQRGAAGDGEPRCRHEGAGARPEYGVRHLGRAGGLGVIGEQQRLPLRGARARGDPAAAQPGRARSGAPSPGAGGRAGGGVEGERSAAPAAAGSRGAAEGRTPRNGGCRGRPGGGRGWASCLARERCHGVCGGLALVVMGGRRRKRGCLGVSWGTEGLKAVMFSHTGATAGRPGLGGRGSHRPGSPPGSFMPAYLLRRCFRCNRAETM